MLCVLTPEKSQVYRVISKNEHIADKLTQNITTFQILGRVIIMGDLNARTAVAPSTRERQYVIKN